MKRARVHALLAARATAVRLLLVGFCVVSNAALLAKDLRGFGKSHGLERSVADFEARMLPLRAVLDRPVVGYVSDKPQITWTQYVLAPVIVVGSGDLPLVVGDFRLGPPDLDAYARRGLVPVRDFGAGLFLFARKG